MKKRFWLLLILLAAGLTAAFVFVYTSEDRQGPEIHFPDTTIHYTEGENESELLDGVTAEDQQDGDVSASLRVEKVLFENDGTVIVTYIAKDSSNNITKETRIISGEASDTAEPADTQPAADETADEEQIDKPETADPEKSAGEAANEAAIAALAPEAPRFYLTQYELTLPVGSEFYALDYVHTIEDDADSIDTLSMGIQVVGEVNTSVPGVYQMTYYVVDSSQNVSNNAVLTVTIK